MVVDSNKVFQEVSVKIKKNDRLVFGFGESWFYFSKSVVRRVSPDKIILG